MLRTEGPSILASVELQGLANLQVDQNLGARSPFLDRGFCLQTDFSRLIVSSPPEIGRVDPSWLLIALYHLHHEGHLPGPHSGPCLGRHGTA